MGRGGREASKSSVTCAGEGLLAKIITPVTTGTVDDGNDDDDDDK